MPTYPKLVRRTDQSLTCRQLVKAPPTGAGHGAAVDGNLPVGAGRFEDRRASDSLVPEAVKRCNDVCHDRQADLGGGRGPDGQANWGFQPRDILWC